MSEKSVGVQTGPGLPALLTVLFVGLKLGHVIDWSWLWVLSPLWISASLAAVIFAIALILLAVADK